MPSNLEEKVAQCLAATNLTMSQLAVKMSLSEPELTTLCRLGDPRLSELEQLGQCLRVPASYFLNGSFNQAGVGNTQKIKIGKAAAHELAAQLGVCRRALEQSQQLVAAKDALLASQEVVITSKEEIISLLRGGYNRPN